MPPIHLTSDQVRAWRLARHHLNRRAPRSRLIEVVADLCGAHAQLMSAAELSLWARVKDLRPEDVREALWERRTLVKTWGMRGTLHLFPAKDFPLVAAALSTRIGYIRNVWLKYFGVTLEQLEAMIEAVRGTLSDRPISRVELAEAVARRTGPKMRAKLLSGWGTMLKPAASRGALIFGPTRGQNVTFVRPDRWLRGWRSISPERAVREVLLRFLETYGPATHEDFARWWGIDPAPARRLFEAAGEKIEAVEVDGRRVWVRREQARRIRQALPPRPAETVRLLPHFDPFVIAYRPRDDLVEPRFASRIFRPQAWISPVVLVDGRAAGVWEQRRRGGQVELTVEPFGVLAAGVKRALADEAAALGKFLGAPVAVAFRG